MRENSDRMAEALQLPRLELTGGFHLLDGAGSEVHLSSRKARALLAILALSPGASTTRARLKTLLWGSRGEQQAGDSLRQTLVTLRKELSGLGADVLVARDDTVGLDPKTIAVDVVAFGDAEQHGDYAAAAALYRGPLLDGLDIGDNEFEAWLGAERDALQARATAIFERFAGDLNGEARVAAARRLVALDPLREASHRTLMSAYLANGEAALAKKQFETCKTLLERELGVAPARETTELIAKPLADAPRGAAVSPAKPTIAVLPFTNMSGDPEQEYFSDGITEDIITELARYHSLAVVARNSSFLFRGAEADLAAVRRALGVHYIVEGSIRKAGARVRITAQLIDAATGSHLWAERYDRTIEDVFAVQDEVVQTIVSTLEGRLAATGAAQARGKPTTSWVAYDYFLRGRELSNRYRISEADDFLARAIDLDPGYVHAYAWRASTLVVKYWYDLKPETLRHAAACAEKALSLDDSDAWCHQAMGFVSLHSNKLALAGMHFERAMSLNPNDVNITVDYANWLCYMGRFDEALRCLDLATQRDPFPPSWMWEARGTTLLQCKRYEEAIAAFQKAPIENFFTHALLAATYAWAGQMEDARRALTLACEGKTELTVSFFEQMPWADEAHRKHILDGLRKAGLPE